ncbi:DUF1302 domain-containing protein [Massilia sp. S19_KUP03_FR1]|uniref:DUF1302 domain-containing protein n=1 Tax=Massilia sp. S19_KUP03_FR1 TaxID=3025503 RepID=UPI002FCD9B8A
MQRTRRVIAWLAGGALGAGLEAHALETGVSGRITFGSVVRLESPDPDLLTALNAPLVGLAGRASGSNADDANLNFRRHDAVSTAIKGYLDLSAREGDFSALVRVKAWHDGALARGTRPWGNSLNGYTADVPLGDAGAARLARFSGVALLDAWVQQSVALGSARLLGRIGRQSLAWGERSAVGGGLDALSARDLPAQRRASAVAQETRVASPMAFARLELTPALALEGFVGGRFQPTTLDLCGTFWAVSDYLAPGCNVVMSGLPVLNDRARVATGALLKRLPTPDSGAHDAGLALLFKAFGLDVGLYQARYTWRTPMPGLRRSSRIGPPIVPGDPDGKNMAFLTEYPDNIALSALTVARKQGDTTVFGELSYRPRAPFMLAPGDALPPFLSPSAPALLRVAADAVAPGGIFHGYDLHPSAQLQIGVQQDGKVGATPLSATLEVVAKHAIGLPDPALRRYGRADLFGVGPVFGVCTVTTANPARQCTQAGYVSSDAWGYRLRVEARWPAVAPDLMPGLAASASAAFVHDVRGWSNDFLLNQGRKTLNLGVRLEYRQRYLFEIAWLPVWGGDYNPLSDRDTLALAAGIKF